MDECACRASVEKWDVQEITCPGPSGGNPFVEQEIYGEFVSKSEQKRVRGFYDGDGVYKVRFMPRFEEEYRFTLSGSFLNSEPAGHFFVTPPSAGNHGPVHVEKAHHFAYEDGTPHYSFGTTCYAWAFQSDGRIQQTLKTLQGGPFNKLRFCVFPKHYDYNLSEPRSYPYEGEPMDSSVLTPEIFTNTPESARATISTIPALTRPTSAIWNAAFCACASKTSRPTSSCCIPTTAGDSA